jgi:uncharacterized UPF0146 family protein
MQVLICLPIKDEEKLLKKNVEILLNYLKKNSWPFSYYLLLMVNGSSDNSDKIAKKLENKYKNEVKYLEIKKAGKGRAIKYCFDKFLDKDILIYMDVDLAVSLKYLNDLVEPIINKEAKLVIGSRLLKDSKTKRSVYRNFTSRFYNLFTKFFFKHNLSDFQCGFKAIDKNTYKILRPQLKNNSWFFDTEWIILSLHNNFKVKEIPVDWQDNRYSTRKSSVKSVKLALIFLINLIVLKLKNKKKTS